MDDEFSIEGLYQIVFTGLPATGVEIERVRENFGRVFKIPQSQMDIIFSGGPVVLQTDLDWSEAVKYRLVMKEMGALCEIIRSTEAGGKTRSLVPCPECKSMQVGDICSECEFDIKAYRAQMESEGNVEVPGTGYIKNRRWSERRHKPERRGNVRFEESRRVGAERRLSGGNWNSI